MFGVARVLRAAFARARLLPRARIFPRSFVARVLPTAFICSRPAPCPCALLFVVPLPALRCSLRYVAAFIRSRCIPGDALLFLPPAPLFSPPIPFHLCYPFPLLSFTHFVIYITFPFLFTFYLYLFYCTFTLCCYTSRAAARAARTARAFARVCRARAPTRVLPTAAPFAAAFVRPHAARSLLPFPPPAAHCRPPTYLRPPTAACPCSCGYSSPTGLPRCCRSTTCRPLPGYVVRSRPSPLPTYLRPPPVPTTTCRPSCPRLPFATPLITPFPMLPQTTCPVQFCLPGFLPLFQFAARSAAAVLLPVVPRSVFFHQPVRPFPPAAHSSPPMTVTTTYRFVPAPVAARCCAAPPTAARTVPTCSCCRCSCSGCGRPRSRSPTHRVPRLQFVPQFHAALQRLPAAGGPAGSSPAVAAPPCTHLPPAGHLPPPPFAPARVRARVRCCRCAALLDCSCARSPLLPLALRCCPARLPCRVRAVCGRVRCPTHHGRATPAAARCPARVLLPTYQRRCAFGSRARFYPVVGCSCRPVRCPRARSRCPPRAPPTSCPPFPTVVPFAPPPPAPRCAHRAFYPAALPRSLPRILPRVVPRSLRLRYHARCGPLPARVAVPSPLVVVLRSTYVTQLHARGSG